MNINLQPGLLLTGIISIQCSDYHSAFRLREGEVLLQSKSRGRLIHVSDFVNEVNGRLVLRNKDGKIEMDAREIIYPGSNGDAWWDHEQLLDQVR